MRRNGGYLFCLMVCVLALSVPVCPQIKKATPSIAIIDTNAFYDDSSGIKELSDALRPLDEEMKPFNEYVTGHVNKYNELVKETRGLLNHQEGCLDTNKLRKLTDEIANEQLLIRGEEVRAKEFYDGRLNELAKPIMSKVTESLKKFAASRGYALILDKSKFEASQAITDIDIFPDVTADFIKFFNDKYPAK